MNELFGRYRERLRTMVRLRLHPKLQGRLDASDVVQDALAEAARVLPEYLEQQALPFFLWLRRITGQQLIMAHRRHLGARRRDAGREVTLHSASASSGSLTAHLLGRLPAPPEEAIRVELQSRLDELLGQLDEVDREVLVLRYFEQLSNAKTAQVLGIDKSAASKRHIRALERLETLLSEFPEFRGL